jgi:hypothetical protein
MISGVPFDILDDLDRLTTGFLGDDPGGGGGAGTDLLTDGETLDTGGAAVYLGNIAIGCALFLGDSVS